MAFQQKDTKLTSRLEPIAIDNIKTCQVLKIKQCCNQRIQLISQPEVSKTNMEKWCSNHATLKSDNNQLLII